MKKLQIGISLLLLLIASLSGYAQSEKLQYWKDIPGFLEAQTNALSKEIQTILKDNPPQLQPSAQRKLALFSIDGLLHDTRLDTTAALKSFIVDRMQQVLNDFKIAAPRKGMQVYKLYNQGFLVRTESATIGFDLVMANTKHGRLIDSAQMKAIVSLCDVLFVSHIHGDHADLEVAKMFASQQKQVFVPTGMWEGVSTYIQPLRDTMVLDKQILLHNGKRITVKVFPGHQDETVLNNVYLVTTKEGYTMMHTGDQYNKKDLVWLRRVGQLAKVDVLLLHNWIHDIEEIVKGINPKLVVSGHENEMAHSIDHREPYWLSFRRMKNIASPFLVMAWGEHYLYK